jgi:REP element-mobilizing transposase RayT
MPTPAQPRRNTEGNGPLAYFLTFTTYGTWLHGDARGSVDTAHREFETPRAARNADRERAMRHHMTGESVVMDRELRNAVTAAIRTACEYKGWVLEAVNVRTNHVHVVVGAPIEPERVLTTLKAWATRRCRERGLLAPEARFWTRHGSTRYLWTERDIEKAATYVVEGQD